ncbi:hypothetical protein GCM10012289_24810 [Nonomuraea cavernae]|uniref:Uncharacterized protein n=1 Tax=Nonomuraea cavernae TaxID=2045107 RepID=A0A917YV16_9ACTN|nr:hypothetical protein GCM10012289_24810 [Nonomuraea cavernae]
MLSFCVTSRWSNSGAALRTSSWTGSLVVISGAALDRVSTGVSLPATVGISTDCSSVGSLLGTGTWTLCVGKGCGFCACVGSGRFCGGLDVVFFGVGAFEGDLVTVRVIVVSGSSGVGVPSVVVTVTVTCGSLSHA